MTTLNNVKNACYFMYKTFIKNNKFYNFNKAIRKK